MKVKELRQLSELDLEGKTAELKKELMKINSQIAIGTVPKSPGKVKQIKKTIARIMTLRHEKILNINQKQAFAKNESKTENKIQSKKGGQKKQ